MAPALTLCECVFLLPSPCTLCSMFFLDPFVFWPRKSLHLLGERQNQPIEPFTHSCVTWSGERLSSFSSCTSSFLSSVSLRSPCQHQICGCLIQSWSAQIPTSEQLLWLIEDAFKLCCPFVLACFTCGNSSSLSVGCLKSQMYTICRDSLIATPSSHLPRNVIWKRKLRFSLIFFGWYRNLYFKDVNTKTTTRSYIDPQSRVIISKIHVNIYVGQEMSIM